MTGHGSSQLNLHLLNIFKEGELAEKATIKEHLIVRNEAGRRVKRSIHHYSLDAILASHAGLSPNEIWEETDSVWLTQKQMANIFGVNVRTVNEHLQTIYDTAELQQDATIRDFRIVRNEAGRDPPNVIDIANIEPGAGPATKSMTDAERERRAAYSVVKSALLSEHGKLDNYSRRPAPTMTRRAMWRRRSSPPFKHGRGTHHRAGRTPPWSHWHCSPLRATRSRKTSSSA